LDFDLERGIIRDRLSGRRLAGIGPAALEAIFDELERELGEAVPALVIEAQRRFVTGGFYSPDEIDSVVDLRAQFALRGLGYIREMSLTRERLELILENTCLHLIVAGFMQGVFELVNGAGSRIDWQLSPDDVLTVSVTRD
jgi:hypothetical protein